MSNEENQYNEQIAAARKLFWQGYTMDDSCYVRPIILRSWQRSRDMKVDPHTKAIRMLTLEELQKVRNANATLLETTIPNIDLFYNSIRDSLTNIIVTDANGIVLYSKGAGTGFDNQPSMAICGFDVSETYDGTTAMGLCLVEKQAVYVTGSEHYKSIFDNWHCTAAPIFNPEGTLIGIVAFLIHRSELHIHTLGMATAVSNAITEQIKLRLLLHKHRTILELLNEAVIVLDKNQCITEINSYAQKIFKTTTQFVGYSVSYIIRNDEAIQQVYKSPFIDDQEVTLTLADGGQLHCTLSASQTEDGGTIINLRERKRMQHFAKQFLGTTAKFTFDDIIGVSESIHNVKNLAKAASSHAASILVLGESGVGKELFAQAIHNASPRKDRPFIAINCGAIPRDLVQSELFGYEPGTFTGASKAGKLGKFEMADGGTIFLDEIGDMALNVQVNLLRVLQEGTFMRVGGKIAREVNVRIIAATHRDLISAVTSGSFRKDLYYRLNVFGLTIPPLRERITDVSLLAHFFLEKYSPSMEKKLLGFSPEAMQCLLDYHWPGNIRELENVIERAIIVSNQGYIQKKDLPTEIITANVPSRTSFVMPQNLVQTERVQTLNNSTLNAHGAQLIIDTLVQTRGNIRAAAAILGISRGTLYSRIKQYAIDPAKLRL